MDSRKIFKYLCAVVYKTFLIVIAVFFLTSCQPTANSKIPQANVNIDFENSTQNGLINPSSITDENQYSGKFSTVVKPDAIYGAGWEGNFPDSLSGRTTRVIVSFFIHADSNSRPAFAFSLDKEGQNYYWFAIPVDEKYCNGEWNQIQDTLLIPGDFTEATYKIKTFLWLSNGAGKAFADDLSIQFHGANFESFLPSIQKMKIQPKQTLSIKNATLSLGANNELISFTSERSPSIRSLVFIEEWKEANDSTFKHEHSFLIYKGVQNDTAIFYVKNSRMYGEIKWNMTEEQFYLCSNFDFQSECEYKRVALAMEFENAPVSLLTNDNLWIPNMEKEYWLGNGGFIINAKNHSWFIQNKNQFTSIQLSKNTVYFNYDCKYDHPLIHYPLRKDAERGYFLDKGCSQMSKGYTLHSDMHWNKIFSQGKVPVISKFPFAFEAAYLFTEHADYTDYRTHLAVCYGSDSIQQLTNAMKGFVGNKIPVTKSVFYSNAEKVNNSESLKEINSPIASVKEHPVYEKLIRDLNSLGWDIALHTPDHYTSNTKEIQEALQFFKSSYNSNCWIDHGYDNGVSDNREDLMCDALLPNSKYYTLPLWKQFGIENVWNSWYEDQTELKVRGFDQHMQINYPFMNTACPKPLLFSHPTRSGHLTHWLSNSIVDYNDPIWWNYYFNAKVLDRLCINKGIVINHCYPARVKPNQYFWINDGKYFKIHPEFEKALNTLRDYRDQGKVWLCTIRDLVKYQNQLKNVEIKYRSKQIVVTNNQASIVNGVTLIVPGNLKIVPKSNLKMKINMSGETMIVFDLKAQEQILIDFE